MSIENKELLRETIGRMANAYTALELAKQECEDVVCSELDAFVSGVNAAVPEPFKKAMISQEKAIASNKARKYADQVKQAAEMVDAYYGEMEEA